MLPTERDLVGRSCLERLELLANAALDAKRQARTAAFLEADMESASASDADAGASEDQSEDQEDAGWAGWVSPSASETSTSSPSTPAEVPGVDRAAVQRPRHGNIFCPIGASRPAVDAGPAWTGLALEEQRSLCAERLTWAETVRLVGFPAKHTHASDSCPYNFAGEPCTYFIAMPGAKGGPGQYIGYSTAMNHRLRQHWGELAGGAAKLRGRAKVPALVVLGMGDSMARRLEFALKNLTPPKDLPPVFGKGALARRLLLLLVLLRNDHWDTPGTKNRASILAQPLTLLWGPAYAHLAGLAPPGYPWPLQVRHCVAHPRALNYSDGTTPASVEGQTLPPEAEPHYRPRPAPPPRARSSDRGARGTPKTRPTPRAKASSRRGRAED